MRHRISVTVMSGQLISLFLSKEKTLVSKSKSRFRIQRHKPAPVVLSCNFLTTSICLKSEHPIAFMNEHFLVMQSRVSMAINQPIAAQLLRAVC